jgi:hypothetical protein
MNFSGESILESLLRAGDGEFTALRIQPLGVKVDHISSYQIPNMTYMARIHPEYTDTLEAVVVPCRAVLVGLIAEKQLGALVLRQVLDVIHKVCPIYGFCVRPSLMPLATADLVQRGGIFCMPHVAAEQAHQAERLAAWLIKGFGLESMGVVV